MINDFQQLALRFTDPVQHNYEVIRDIMLADATMAAHSRATGFDQATVSETVRGQPGVDAIVPPAPWAQ